MVWWWRKEEDTTTHFTQKYKNEKNLKGRPHHFDISRGRPKYEHVGAVPPSNHGVLLKHLWNFWVHLKKKKTYKIVVTLKINMKIIGLPSQSNYLLGLAPLKWKIRILRNHVGMYMQNSYISFFFIFLKKMSLHKCESVKEKERRACTHLNIKKKIKGRCHARLTCQHYQIQCLLCRWHWTFFYYWVGDDIELILLIWRSGFKLVWISLDDYEKLPGASLVEAWSTSSPWGCYPLIKY